MRAPSEEAEMRLFLEASGGDSGVAPSADDDFEVAMVGTGGALEELATILTDLLSYRS